MSVRNPFLYIAIVVVGLLAVAEVDSSRVEAKLSSKPTIECNHPRDLQDAKRLAKSAWQKPYGPSKSDRRNWKIIKVCARTNYQREVRFPNLWVKYRSLFAEDRKVLRLKDACGNESTSSVLHCIEYASLIHGFPASTLEAIARCESTLNPYAHNSSGASGLFQFIPSTWSATVARMISAGEEIKNNIYSAKWSSLAAAWKMSQDGTGEWDCA